MIILISQYFEGHVEAGSHDQVIKKVLAHNPLCAYATGEECEESLQPCVLTNC